MSRLAVGCPLLAGTAAIVPAPDLSTNAPATGVVSMNSIRWFESFL